MRVEKDSIGEWHRGVPLSAKWPIFRGLAIRFVGLGCFGVWAGVAPLNSAVVASGTFVATGQNKLVQHFEGGIIREISVKDGDVVEANQVLVRMDDTAANAKLRRLVLKKYRLLAMKARLEAEMSSSKTIETPAAFSQSARDLDIKAILERQRAELRARRASLATEESVLLKQIAGLEESIRGYQAQVQSTKERIALFAEELKDKNSLLGQQLVRKSDVLALRRSEASLGGELGEYLGRIADSKERIAQANERIAQLHSTALRDAIKELRETVPRRAGGGSGRRRGADSPRPGRGRPGRRPFAGPWHRGEEELPYAGWRRLSWRRDPWAPTDRRRTHHRR